MKHRLYANNVCSFVILFLFSTFALNRPCIYCSALLLILFASSCHWFDKCYVDLSRNWFQASHTTSLPYPPSQAVEWSRASEDGSFLANAINETALIMGGAIVEEMKRRTMIRPEWTGIGIGWMRSWLGTREWRLPCLDVYVRL